jgi:hypothetical protein
MILIGLYPTKPVIADSEDAMAATLSVAAGALLGLTKNEDVIFIEMSQAVQGSPLADFAISTVGLRAVLVAVGI